MLLLHWNVTSKVLSLVPSHKDFVFLSIQTQYLTAYSHFTPQTVLWLRAGLGPQLAFKMWAKVTRAAASAAAQIFYLPKYLQLPDMNCCGAIRTITNNQQQRKMQGKGNKQKADHPIFWNWNLQGPKWQKDVNSLNPTVICILSAFPLSDHVKRFQRLPQSKARIWKKYSK